MAGVGAVFFAAGVVGAFFDGVTGPFDAAFGAGFFAATVADVVFVAAEGSLRFAVVLPGTVVA